MSRRRLYNWELPMTVTLLERTLITYYATRYAKDFREVLRGMLRKYVDSDNTFDTDAYLRVVDKILVPEFEGKDERMVAKLKEVSQDYVTKRKVRNQNDSEVGAGRVRKAPRIGD